MLEAAVLDGGVHCCNYRSLCTGDRSSKTSRGNTFVIFVFAEPNNTLNLQWDGNIPVCECSKQIAALPGMRKELD